LAFTKKKHARSGKLKDVYMGNDWIREVLADLEMFARANGLEDDLVDAVAKAALIAKERFGTTPDNLELTLPIDHRWHTKH
jgi:hypothetical protein